MDWVRRIRLQHRVEVAVAVVVAGFAAVGRGLFDEVVAAEVGVGCVGC